METSVRRNSDDRRSWVLLYLMSFGFAVTVAPLIFVPQGQADEIAVILAAPILALLVVPRLVRAALGREAVLVLPLPRVGLRLLWEDAVIAVMGVAGIVVQAVFALRSYWQSNLGTAGSWLAFGSYVLVIVVVLFILQARVLRRWGARG